MGCDTLNTRQHAKPYRPCAKIIWRNNTYRNHSPAASENINKFRTHTSEIMSSEFHIIPRPKKSTLPQLPKKRKRNAAIDEISFDFDKREDYLTGFHKRKVERIKRAQAENDKKLKEERIQQRKEVIRHSHTTFLKANAASYEKSARRS